jgi:hypothetical protein
MMPTLALLPPGMASRTPRTAAMNAVVAPHKIALTDTSIANTNMGSCEINQITYEAVLNNVKID